MCVVPPIVKYHIIFIIFIIILFYDLYIFFILAIIHLLLPSKFHITCPKCKINMGVNKDNIVIYKLSRYCDHCGQDLMKCKAQTNKEIEKRKEKLHPRG